MRYVCFLPGTVKNDEISLLVQDERPIGPPASPVAQMGFLNWGDDVDESAMFATLSTDGMGGQIRVTVNLGVSEMAEYHTEKSSCRSGKFNCISR